MDNLNIAGEPHCNIPQTPLPLLQKARRKRSVQDKLICKFNDIRYQLTEPLILQYMRSRYEHLYTPLDENPLISITIPTWDRGQLLIDRTLPSIFAQTYQNLEVIVVGDCCIDDTPRILSQVDDPRFKFINLSKRTKYPDDKKLAWFVSGVAPSNYGINIANGKWITYYDDDDIMAPDFIESLFNFAKEGNYEFVAGLYEEERDGIKLTKGQRSGEHIEFGGHSTWLYRSYLRFFRYNINSWRKAYNCPQDIDLLHRFYNAGVRMEVLNKVISYILPRPGETKIGLDARLS